MRLHHRRRMAVHVMLRQLVEGRKPKDAYLEVLDLLQSAGAGFGFANDETHVGRYYRESIPALAMAFPVVWLRHSGILGGSGPAPHARLGTISLRARTSPGLIGQLR